MDTATLGVMLRRRDGDLSVFREDSAAKQEELLHALAQLQVGAGGAVGVASLGWGCSGAGSQLGQRAQPRAQLPRTRPPPTPCRRATLRSRACGGR